MFFLSCWKRVTKIFKNGLESCMHKVVSIIQLWETQELYCQRRKSRSMTLRQATIHDVTDEWSPIGLRSNIGKFWFASATDCRFMMSSLWDDTIPSAFTFAPTACVDHDYSLLKESWLSVENSRSFVSSQNAGFMELLKSRTTSVELELKWSRNRRNRNAICRDFSKGRNTRNPRTLPFLQLWKNSDPGVLIQVSRKFESSS